MNERNPESNEVAEKRWEEVVAKIRGSEKLYLSVLNSVRSSMDFEGFKIELMKKG